MSDPLDEAMAELRREYLLEAPARLAELRKDLLALRAGEADAPQSLISRFQRLGGSGGSYGYPEISEIAKGAETYLRQTGLPDAEIVADHLSELVDRLATVFDAAGREIGLPRGGATEFGWRALVIGPDGPFRQEVASGLREQGFLTRTDVETGEPREVKLTDVCSKSYGTIAIGYDEQREREKHRAASIRERADERNALTGPPV